MWNFLLKSYFIECMQFEFQKTIKKCNFHLKTMKMVDLKKSLRTMVIGFRIDWVQKN